MKQLQKHGPPKDSKTVSKLKEELQKEEEMILELDLQLGKYVDIDSGDENLDSTEADVSAEDVV